MSRAEVSDAADLHASLTAATEAVAFQRSLHRAGYFVDCLWHRFAGNSAIASSSSAAGRSSWASSTSRPTASPTAGEFLDPHARDRARPEARRTKGRTSSTSAANRRGRARSRFRSRRRLRRVVPVVERARAADVAVPISVDTMKAEVARRCLEAGAAIVNDVSGLPRSRRWSASPRSTGPASSSCTCRARRRRCRSNPQYADVVREVARVLRGAVADSGANRVSPRKRCASTPESGSARRTSTTSNCSRTSERSRGSAGRSASACRARGSSGSSAAAQRHERTGRVARGRVLRRRARRGPRAASPRRGRDPRRRRPARRDRPASALSARSCYNSDVPVEVRVSGRRLTVSADSQISKHSAASMAERREGRVAATRAASRPRQKNRWLLAAADALEARADEIAGGQRAGRRRRAGVRPERRRDRPAHAHARRASQAAADGLRQVAALPDPVGEVRESGVRPNGLQVLKVGVPLGVIFFIYESRPNVTVDAAGAVRQERQRGHPARRQGGDSLEHRPAPRPGRRTGDGAGCPPTRCNSSPTTDREAVGHLLTLGELHRPRDPARRRSR